MWTSAPGPTTQVDLLVEEHRHLGRLHAALGDVVGVVERDRQVLAGEGGAEQADVGERRALAGAGGGLAPAPSAPPAARRRGAGSAGRPSGAEVERPAPPSSRPSLGSPPCGESTEPHRRSSIAVAAAIAARSFGRSRARRVPPSTIARPPFFSFALAPVRRATSPEKSGSWPTRSASPRPAASAGPVEGAAAAAPRRSRARCRAARRRAAPSPRPAPWGWSGRRRSRRPSPRAPARRPRPVARPSRSGAGPRRRRRRPRRLRVGAGRGSPACHSTCSGRRALGT